RRIFFMAVAFDHNMERISEARISITPDEINSLPLRTFNGKTHVISQHDQLVKVVKEIESHEIIGFDTETRPSFKKGQVHQVSLLQLAIPRKVFLIRLNHTGITEELAGLFSNGGVIKAGVGIRDDLKALQKLRAFEPAG